MNHGVAAAALRRGRRKNSKPRRAVGQSSYYHKVLALARTGNLRQGKNPPKQKVKKLGKSRGPYRRPGKKDNFPKELILQALGILGTSLVVLGLLACFIGFIDGLTPARYVGFSMIGLGCPLCLVAIFCKREYTTSSQIREGFASFAENGDGSSQFKPTTDSLGNALMNSNITSELPPPMERLEPNSSKELDVEDTEGEDLNSVPIRRFHTLSPMPELPVSTVNNIQPLNTLPDTVEQVAPVGSTEDQKY